MFKKLFTFLLLWASFFGLCFWQSLVINSWDDNGTWTNTYIVKGNIDKNSYWITNIKSYLYDENSNAYVNNLFLNLRPWENKKLKFKFVNTSSVDLNIDVRFSDSNMSKWITPVRWCEPLNDTKDFLAFNDGTWLKLTVPANWELEKEINVKFPITAWGLVRWCMAYIITRDPDRQWINIAFVKKNFIDVFVWWEIDLNNALIFTILEKDTKIHDLSSNSKIKAYFDESKNLIIEANLKNNWSLDEIANVSGTISNIFGYKDTFFWKDITLSTIDSQWVFLTTKWNKSFALPYYKWLYKIELFVNYKPVFDFETSNMNIDPKILEWWTLIEKASIFLMPWMALVISVVFLILVKMAFRKRITK